MISLLTCEDRKSGPRTSCGYCCLFAEKELFSRQFCCMNDSASKDCILDFVFSIYYIPLLQTTGTSSSIIFIDLKMLRKN